MLRIGERIHQIRMQKGLSQGDIEKASGLLRCYISRVEHGHTVPSLETLERLSHALDVPFYELFYSGDGHAPKYEAQSRTLEELAEDTGAHGTEARLLLELKGLGAKMSDADRVLLIEFARRLAFPTGGETEGRKERRSPRRSIQTRGPTADPM